MRTMRLVKQYSKTWVAAAVAAACSSTTDGGPGTGAVVVASVTVTPASPALVVGDTLRFAATPLDAGGAPIAGLTATWAVAPLAVASITTAGLLTALTAGAPTITATVNGVSGQTTANVTIVAPANAECATPGAGWIFCDDFEQNRLTQYFEVDTANGNFVRAAGVGRNNSYGMRARYAAGAVLVGSLKVAFGLTPDPYVDPVDAGTTKYREIYWRHWLRRAPGWTGGGGDKLSRATSFVTANWAQSMIAHVWSGNPSTTDRFHVLVEPASGTDLAGNLVTTTYNDFNNLRWMGPDASNTAIFSDANAGTWYCVEARVRWNDAGQSNGVFQLWINDVLEAERTGLNWVGSYNAYGINNIHLENWWNAGSPQAQERYLDNFVVSTQRINC